MDLDLEKIVNNNPTYLLKILADTNAVAFQNKIFENKENSFFLQYSSTAYSSQAKIECYDFLLEHNYNISDINYNKSFNFTSFLKLKPNENLMENKPAPDFLWLFNKDQTLLMHIIDSLNAKDIQKLREYPILEMGFLSNQPKIIDKLFNKGFEFINDEFEKKIKEKLKESNYKDTADIYWNKKLQNNNVMEDEQYAHFKEIFLKEIAKVTVKKDYHTKYILDWIQLKLDKVLNKEQKLDLLKEALNTPDTRLLNAIKKSIGFKPSEYTNFLIDNMPLINPHEIIVEPIINNISVLNEHEGGWKNFLSFLKIKNISITEGKGYNNKSANKQAIERSFFRKIKEQLGYEELLKMKVGEHSLFSHILNLDSSLYLPMKNILDIDPVINGVPLSKKIDNLTVEDTPILRNILEETWLSKKENVDFDKLGKICENGFIMLSHQVLKNTLTIKEKESLLPSLLEICTYSIGNTSINTWDKELDQKRFGSPTCIFKSLYLELTEDKTVNWKNIKFTQSVLNQIKDSELYFDIKARTMFHELSSENAINQITKNKKNKI